MNMSRRPNDARCARFFRTMIIPLAAAVPGYSSAAGNPDNSARDDDRYLNVIVRFADIALEHGRDTYGPKHIPLFVDSLSVTDYKPYRWKSRVDDPQQADYPAEQISANFGIQQQLQITLRELSNLTGDSRYSDAARDAATYAMQNLADGGGLFYWGHHETYDALSDRVTGLGNPPIHEMKTMVPDFRYLYGLDPAAVKKNIEQYMIMGIRDWEKLAFTRHLTHGRPYRNPWDNVSRINTSQEVPFQTDMNMEMFHYGLPFMDAGISYYQLTGDERAYEVAYQMLKRFMDMRDPKTGLGARSYAYNGSKGENVTTTKFERYRWAPPLLLKKAEMLGVDTGKGKALLTWGVEELVAVKDYGFRIKPPPSLLWSYALGYRLSKELPLWEAAREIAKGYGLGDIGGPAGDGYKPSVGTFELQPIEGYSASDIRIRNRANNMNGFVIHAMVELYEATGRKEFLERAEHVANVILDNLYDNGLFVRHKNGLYARLGDMTPLAFLHLCAAQRGRKPDVDSVFPRDLYLRVRHAGPISDKVWDNEVVYCLDKPAKGGE